MNYVLCVFFCLVFGSSIQSQVMWPGDANNNGKVNAVDLLFVGLGYNAKGPLRPNASTRWEVQNFNVWSQSFPNGLNYAFADGNGDGEIDDKDNKDVIEVNFGLTHGSLRPNGFVKGQKGSAPQLKLSTTQRVVAPGSTIFVDLDLGDAAHPLDFYGIAVQMGYTSRLVRSSEFEDEVTPWFEATGEDTKDLYATPGNNGQAELAITRIDQQAIKGFGRMGKIKLVIEDIIVGRPVDTLRITIDSVLLIDKNLKSTAVAHDTLLIFVTKNPALVGTKELRQDPSLLQISPNPSNGDFWIKTPLGIKHWEVYDPLGRLISVHTQAQGIGQWKIHTGAQVPGVYLLRGTGEQGFVSKSILLAPFY